MGGRHAALRALLAALALLAGGAGRLPAAAPVTAPALSPHSAPSRGGAAAREEFLIVSSVDASHRRIVLKRPTEVTLAVRVTDRTAYRNEAGRPLRLADLRAGDTAYVTFVEPAAGDYEAVLVRLGPMTVEELQKRFLRAAPP
jgi:hypothetical protein